MRKLRYWQKVTAIVLAIQLVGGLATIALPRREIFPLFSWFLFSLVPQPGPSYSIRLLEWDGKKLEKEPLYGDAYGYVLVPHSVTVAKLVQRLGVAIERKKDKDVVELRRLLEKNWLKPGARYQLVRVEGDPIERYKSGRATEVRGIIFEYGVQP